MSEKTERIQNSRLMAEGEDGRPPVIDPGEESGNIPSARITDFRDGLKVQEHPFPLKLALHFAVTLFDCAVGAYPFWSIGLYPEYSPGDVSEHLRICELSGWSRSTRK